MQTRHRNQIDSKMRTELDMMTTNQAESQISIGRRSSLTRRLFGPWESRKAGCTATGGRMC